VGEFGDKFRKEREKKGFSLDDVSNVTKIGSRMLQAIEEERFDQLPGGVFNKGFIRAYAKHLGLNDNDAVTEYLACLHQAQIDAQASWQPPARAAVPEKRTAPAPASRASDAPAPPPATTEIVELPELQLPRAEHLRPPRRNYSDRRESGIPRGIVIASAVIIVLAAVLWHRHSGSIRTQAASGAPATSAPASQPAAAGSNSPASSASSRPSTSKAQPTSVPSTAAHPSSAVAQPPAANGNEKTAAAGSKESSTREAAPPVSPPAPPPMTLVIRASENSWVSVSADGQVVSSETLIAPAHTSVRASREFVVRVGNAAGVSFLLNGKEIPPQGSESEVQTLVFDSSGLKTAEPAPLSAPPTAN
jgi:cytoskeleton protein RodZ